MPLVTSRAILDASMAAYKAGQALCRRRLQR